MKHGNDAFRTVRKHGPSSSRRTQCDTGNVQAYDAVRYVGSRLENGMTLVRCNGHYLSNEPGKYEWGYCGQRPTLLAKALLEDWFGNEPDGRQRADGLAIAFKYTVIVQLPYGGWFLTNSAMERALKALTAHRTGRQELSPAPPSNGKFVRRQKDWDVNAASAA
jgi:hypothetical protein